MKPFNIITIAYIVCSAALFMAGTTLLPAAGAGGLVRDVLMLSVFGLVLYALLTVQAARRDTGKPVIETVDMPPEIPAVPAVRAEPEPPLQRAA